MARTKQAWDRVGIRFGMLVAGEPFHKLSSTGRNNIWYNCKCDCGVEKAISGSNLRKHGGVQSCGCNRYWGNRAKNIAGQKFGMLTAISETDKRCRKSVVWLFACECGRQKEISAGEVVSLKTLSCGCQKKEPNRVFAVWKQIYREALRRSPEHGGETDISFEEYIYLATQNCTYCGDPPTNEKKDDYSDLVVQYQGLDRVDPLSYYLKTNVVPCCHPCNLAKSDQPVSIWVDFNIKRYDLFVTSENYTKLLPENFNGLDFSTAQEKARSLLRAGELLRASN